MKLANYIAVLVMGSMSTLGIASTHVTPLAPTSQWQLDYAESECRLLRTFGDGGDQITIQFSRLEINDLLEMSLAGRRIPETEHDVLAEVKTSTVSHVQGMHARGFAAVRGSPGIIRFAPNDDLARALRGDAAVNQPTLLNVELSRYYSVQLELGPMKGALLALDKCMDNLMTTWGLDPTKQRQRRSAPEPANEPANWFQPGDYPTGLNRNGIGAVVILRLLVGSDGRVTNCAISKAGGDKSFEDLACRLATARARFKPAIGADGKPMDSVWINGVRWEPAPPFLNRAG